VSLLERNINLALELERCQMKAEAWDGLVMSLPRISGPVEEVMARPDPRSGNVLVFRKSGDRGNENRPLKRGGPERPFDGGSGPFYATPRAAIRGYVPMCRVCRKEGKFSGPNTLIDALDAGWKDCGWSYPIRDIYWRCPDCAAAKGGGHG
jgi:hypothetical protein